MMPLADHFFVQRILEEAFKSKIKLNSFRLLSGGCINRAVLADTSSRQFFIKWNASELFPMFEAEAKGLDVLAKAGVIRVPEVYYYGYNEACSYLVLEFVEQETPAKNFWKNFGTALSMLHRHTRPRFGLDFNNYIGSLPQQNHLNESWIEFFIQNRLEAQLKIGLNKGSIDPEAEQNLQQLYKRLPDLLPEEKPSLIHGDLWNGNFIVAGQVCLIDPAVYYGNREAEIAFTKLFGGFDQKFYYSYEDSFPITAGFEERSDIYNLYPLLVHVNLFGGSYLNQVKQILKRFR
jgi:protein-ribulosamine 3-kinase